VRGYLAGMTSPAVMRRVAASVSRACGAGQGAYDLLDRVADMVADAVPHSGAAWFSMDPHTTLVSGAVVRSLPDSSCFPFFEHNFAGRGVTPYATLARTPVKASGLFAAHRGAPEDSAMWRNVLEPYGLRDELRAACTDNGQCWGAFSLMRKRGDQPFSRREIAFAQAVGAMVGPALRSATIASLDNAGDTDEISGVVLLDDVGGIVNGTAEGLHRLERLVAGRAAGGRFSIPDYLRALADAAAAGQPVSLRLCDPDDRWHVVEAGALLGGGTTVVIRPLHPSELAAGIVLAYRLSPRELEVMELLCQGLTTQEISGRLHISVHTARDHVKHIYAKTDVTSRGELMARLLTEHSLTRLRPKQAMS
jgi:DNA-binding CsgD family transcriptional regulator